MQTDANNGKPLVLYRHIRQSIRDIITTPLGTRLMNPTYGCGLFRYVDSPLTEANILRISQEIHEALVRWERRVRVLRTAIEGVAQEGQFQITVFFEVRENGATVEEVIEVKA